MSLRVVEPGLCTLVVDGGRPRSRSLGVPVGGAADRFALALGNALVGNPPHTAALEITLAGPLLEAGCELAGVVFGAPFTLSSDRQPLTAGTTFTLRPGEAVRIGDTWANLRAYFCVRGGIQSPEILGSRSALEPLRAGVELPCAPGSISSRFIRPDWNWNREPRTLRVVDGPQAAWFDREQVYPQAFRVTPASNRMGLRLAGAALRLPERELVSEPVCPGTVQTTRDGQCIILGVDAQTIGGYPKIAQVITADLDKLGQLRPGDQVQFTPVSLAHAEVLYHEKQAELNQWLTRLRITFLEDMQPVVPVPPGT